MLDTAIELGRDIARNPPFGISVTKEALWHNLEGGSLERAIAFESRGIQLSQATEDAAEKKRSVFEKRPPRIQEHLNAEAPLFVS